MKNVELTLYTSALQELSQVAGKSSILPV